VEAGLSAVSAGVVSAGQADVGESLLRGVADLGGECLRGGVPGEGDSVSPGGQVHLSQAVEHRGFSGPVAGLAEYGQCLPVIGDGLLVAAFSELDLTQVG
jgi:hypothetical protein